MNFNYPPIPFEQVPRKIAGEYRKGFQSGLLHRKETPICIPNERKMTTAFRDLALDVCPLVTVYWLGYRDGMTQQRLNQAKERNEKTNEQK